LDAGRGGGWSAATQAASNDINATGATSPRTAAPMKDDLPIFPKTMMQGIGCKADDENCQCDFCDE
jgi:hypothetical protein